MADDLISRQAMLDGIDKLIKIHFDRTVVLHKARQVAENLPSVQPEQRWIPVEERLPEEYSECLVTYKSDGDQMFMDIVEYEPSFEFDHEKNRFKGNWLFADDCRSVDPEVLAWMPLPEPYQERGETNG